jgi:hypothetical protein
MNEKSNQQKQNNNSFDLMTNLNTPEEEVKKDEFMNKDVETKIDINAEIASPSTDRTVSSATPQRRSYSSSTASAAPQKKVASSSNKTDLSDAAELRRRKKEEEKRQLRIRYGLEAEKEETPLQRKRRRLFQPFLLLQKKRVQNNGGIGEQFPIPIPFAP